MGTKAISRSVLLVVAVCAACASPNRVDEDPLIASSEVDVQPRLRQCGAGYAQPTPAVDDPTPNYVRVSVPVIVAADGTVESVGTPQLIRTIAGNDVRLSSSAREDARYRAESCVFEPATLEGIPVSARYVLTLVVPA